MLRDYVERCVEGIELRVPALHHGPARAIEQVAEACGGVARDDLTLIGSSLGGFYATVMAERLGCRAALVNPAVHPHAHFSRYLGPQKNLYTGEEFILTRDHIDELRAMDPPRITKPGRYWVFLETGDEVLDYRDAVAYYAGARQDVAQGGDHSLAGFPQRLPGLVQWALS